MHDRRCFLKQTSLLAGAIGLGHAEIGSGAGSNNSILPPQQPDTLDLGDHARLAINGMLGGLNPAINYESTFLTILDVQPPYMLHWSTMVSGVMPKFVEALPMLRVMSGSQEHMGLQNGFLQAMLDNMHEDGLVYDRASANRPWNVGVGYGGKDWDEDYANIAGNGRLLAGCVFWHQVTRDPDWKARAQKTAERIFKLTVVDGEFAYYPNPGLGNDFSYPRQSGWTTKKPPDRPDEGFEGATLFYMCQPLRGFAQYVALTGDERFIDLSKRIVRFVLQSKFWGAEDGLTQDASFRRGHFRGHFHGTLAALRGLFDYALIAGDQEVLYFVHDAYQFARERGAHRLGIFPHRARVTEGCTIADMIGLAIALSDAGVGDYWDDVAAFVRNGLISAQATDADELKRVSAAGKHRPPGANWGGRFDGRFRAGNRGVLPGQEIHERVAERTIGQFSHLWGARYQIPQMMSCCTANCSQALYYAWEGITRRSGETATVNLWMNRRAPWIDVFSRLPYEGHLSLQNKGLREVAVRIPGWMPRKRLRCQVNCRDVEPTWLGNRVVFRGLTGNETIVITQPIKLDSVTCSLISLNDPASDAQQIRCDFKGDTAVRVEHPPPEEEHAWYRLFQRDSMLAAVTPRKALAPYIHPERLIQWLPL